MVEEDLSESGVSRVLKEHTVQIGRERSRLRNSTGEGSEVAKKCVLGETLHGVFVKLPISEARARG